MYNKYASGEAQLAKAAHAVEQTARVDQPIATMIDLNQRAVAALRSDIEVLLTAVTGPRPESDNKTQRIDPYNMKSSLELTFSDIAECTRIIGEIRSQIFN